MTTHIKVGVVGCGYWGPNHVRVFSQLPGVEVVGIADASPERRAAVSALFPGLPTFDDHSALLERSGAEAVVVATPTRTHHAVVRDALAAGCHVLCEKPLCTDPAEAEELSALAAASDRVLMVGHIFLFNPGIRMVRDLIVGGEIGEVRSLAAVRTNLGPVRQDVNAAWDLASHDVAIFNWLLGAEPVEVKAMGACFLQPGIEDVAVITLRYAPNVLASIHCSWLDPKKVRQMTVVGSRRMVTWDDLALSNPVAVYEKSVEATRVASDYGDFLRLSMLDGEVRLPKIAPEEPLKNQARAFLDSIRRGEAVASGPAFAAGVVRTLARIDAEIRGSH